MNEPHIDDQTLAAFVDGELGEEDRRRVLEAVDRDPETRRLLMETAAFAADERRREAAARDSAAGLETPGRPDRRGWWTTAGGRIAAAATAAIVLLVVALPVGSRAPDAAALVGHMEIARSGAILDLVRRPEVPGFRSAMDADERAVRLGALIVDLELARRLEDGVSVREVGTRLLSLAADLDLTARVLEVVRRAEDGVAPSRRDVETVESSLRARVPRRAFDAGRALEAVRLAEELGDEAYADRRVIRRALRRASGFELEGAGPVGWLDAGEPPVGAGVAVVGLGRWLP